MRKRERERAVIWIDSICLMITKMNMLCFLFFLSFFLLSIVVCDVHVLSSIRLLLLLFFRRWNEEKNYNRESNNEACTFFSISNKIWKWKDRRINDNSLLYWIGRLFTHFIINFSIWCCLFTHSHTFMDSVWCQW